MSTETVPGGRFSSLHPSARHHPLPRPTGVIASPDCCSVRERGIKISSVKKKQQHSKNSITAFVWGIARFEPHITPPFMTRTLLIRFHVFIRLDYRCAIVAYSIHTETSPTSSFGDESIPREHAKALSRNLVRFAKRDWFIERNIGENVIRYGGGRAACMKVILGWKREWRFNFASALRSPDDSIVSWKV